MILFLIRMFLMMKCHSSMTTFWVVFAMVAILAISVTAYNIADGIRKAKDEMKRNRYLDNSEYDYGHNVNHKSNDE